MTSRLAMRFHRRDIDFGMGAPIPTHWLGGDCHLTRFYDAMSIMFPEGERAFIETVQHYRSRISADAELAYAVTEFIAQEAIHTREHVRYNRRLQAQGAPVEHIERSGAAQQEFARRYLPPIVRLAITTCLEHFTAMFADQLLSEPRGLDGADPAMADIWFWHALEETEHKAVAFDVLTAVMRKPLRRYALRCAAMLFVTVIFSMLQWQMTFQLVRHDRRATDIRGWLRLLRVLFISPGPLTRMLPHWFAWFRPGFHPWQRDNRALVERFSQRFESKYRKAG
ncbi:metal-dependent hydrolase [Paraburkholderia dinghuensis]|nr:metal-dependent hydrolase [Paraburkholderia dinghuensis]